MICLLEQHMLIGAFESALHAQSMLRLLVITQLLRLPWARKPEITCFLAQRKCKSSEITNGLDILCLPTSKYLDQLIPLLEVCRLSMMTVAETEDTEGERKAAILTDNRESHSSIIIRSFDRGGGQKFSYAEQLQGTM